MQDQNDDHDLIPDEWQEGWGHDDQEQDQSAVNADKMAARPVKHDERDFGQMRKPPKRQTFEKPKKTDWSPIDLSHGKQKFTGSREKFIAREKQDLRSGLGQILNASQRAEVAKRLASKRGSGGLYRHEAKKAIKEMIQEGILNKFEAKRILRSTKANKSSGII